MQILDCSHHQRTILLRKCSSLGNNGWWYLLPRYDNPVSCAQIAWYGYGWYVVSIRQCHIPYSSGVSSWLCNFPLWLSELAGQIMRFIAVGFIFFFLILRFFEVLRLWQHAYVHLRLEGGNWELYHRNLNNQGKFKQIRGLMCQHTVHLMILQFYFYKPGLSYKTTSFLDTLPTNNNLDLLLELFCFYF